LALLQGTMRRRVRVKGEEKRRRRKKRKIGE
jgi:hypothetical protein